MGEHVTMTSRIKDSEVLESFQRLRNDLQPNDDLRIQVQLGLTTPAIDGAVSDIATKDAVKTALAADASILHSVQLILQHNITVSIQRQPQQAFDQCKVSYQDQVDGVALARVLAATRRHFPTLDRAELIQRVLGEELTEYYRQREQRLMKLEDLNEQLIVQGTKFREELERQAAERQRQREEEAEAARARMQAEHDGRMADLEVKAKALTDREKQLDDSSSKHARRQHHKDLKKMLESRGQNFSLTRATAQKRYLPHALFVLLMLVPAVLFALSLWSAVYRPGTWNGTPNDWAALLRLPLSAIALALAVVYYIRWNHDWFRQHAEEEFNLKRLDLDVDRASWIVEMMLEWKDEKDAPIPPELIDRLTRNLFALDRRGETVIRHPAQDLASALLQASSSITLPIPGGGSATVNAKGLDRFKRNIGAADKD